MSWKTFLVMYFKAGNEKPSEIIKKVESVGFECITGPVDFLYDWKDKKPSKEEIMELADKLTNALKNTEVMFNIDTHQV